MSYHTHILQYIIKSKKIGLYKQNHTHEIHRCGKNQNIIHELVFITFMVTPGVFSLDRSDRQLHMLMFKEKYCASFGAWFLYFFPLSRVSSTFMCSLKLSVYFCEIQIIVGV